MNINMKIQILLIILVFNYFNYFWFGVGLSWKLPNFKTLAVTSKCVIYHVKWGLHCNFGIWNVS